LRFYGVMAKITAVEWEALRLTFSGKSDVQAYRLTHPNAGKLTAQKAASAFFRRVRGKLSKSEELELRNLGRSRVFEELEKRLNSLTTEFYQGKKVTDCEDNTTRMKATELLARINGLLEAPEEKDDGSGSGSPIKIVISGTEATIEK